MGKKFLTFVAFLFLIGLVSGCAPPPGGDGAGSGDVNFPRFVIETVWFILMCIFVYFMMVTRPREIRETERKKFLKEIAKGQKVIINSSIHGKYVSQTDDVVTVEVAPNLKLKVSPEAVSAIREEKEGSEKAQ